VGFDAPRKVRFAVFVKNFICALRIEVFLWRIRIER
jgi:hypothetical protein